MAPTSSSNSKHDGRQLSPWALLSILSSSFVLCPLACAIGPLFGLKGLSEMRTDPRITGRGMAKAGIVVGSLATAFWIGAAVWWHYNVRRPILNGPSVALAAGFDGDLDGFRAGWCCEADAASDEEAIVFLAELSRRYGRYLGIDQSQLSEDQSVTPSTEEGFRKRVPYVLQFESGPVEAIADFVVFVESGVVLQFSRLEILDDNVGDISYPRARSSSGDNNDSPGSESESDRSSDSA